MVLFEFSYAIHKTGAITLIFLAMVQKCRIYSLKLMLLYVCTCHLYLHGLVPKFVGVIYLILVLSTYFYVFTPENFVLII